MSQIKTSKYGKKYYSSCYKRAFTTKRNAKKWIKKGSYCSKSRSVYRCKRCNFWHVSHLTEKEYLEKVADYKLIDFLKKELEI